MGIVNPYNPKTEMGASLQNAVLALFGNGGSNSKANSEMALANQRQAEAMKHAAEYEQLNRMNAARSPDNIADLASQQTGLPISDIFNYKNYLKTGVRPGITSMTPATNPVTSDIDLSAAAFEPDPNLTRPINDITQYDTFSKTPGRQLSPDQERAISNALFNLNAVDAATGKSNVENIADALHKGAQGQQYQRAVTGDITPADYATVEAGRQGKPLVGNQNGELFGLFDQEQPTVTTPYGAEVVKLKRAETARNLTQAQKNVRDSEALVPVVDPVTGETVYERRANAVGKRVGTKTGEKTYRVDIGKDEKLESDINARFGVKYDKQGNLKDDSQPPLSPDAMRQIKTRYAQEYGKTGDSVNALDTAVKALTGGQDLTPEELVSKKIFGVPVPFTDPVAKNRGLPNRAPVKQVIKNGNPNNLPIPQTQADFDRLPQGAKYIDPDDGQTYMKR